jgi:hypothetical protein
MGKYLIVASAQDLDGWAVTTVMEIGKTEEEWKESPLSSWESVSFSFDKVHR